MENSENGKRESRNKKVGRNHGFVRKEKMERRNSTITKSTWIP